MIRDLTPGVRYAVSTISSGSTGMIRKTSVNTVSTRSVSPPTYAAVTPMIIDMKVAITLATRVTQSVRRVLQISCEKTSWPSCVVPSRWADDGPSFGGKAVACGSSGAIRPGNTATNTMTSRITAPTIALRLCRTARVKRRGSVLTSVSSVLSSASGSGRGSAIRVLEAGSVAISRLSRTRIEHRSDQVRDQHADQHGERVEEEEPLHQRQVVVGRRRVEEIAEAGIREQVLDHDRAAQHITELHREPGQVGENGVARGVVVHDPPARQPLGPGCLHIVLSDRRDHVVAHRVHPQAGRHDHQTERGKERVLQHVPDERRRERRRGPAAVVAGEREPAQLDREGVDEEQPDEEDRDGGDDEQGRGEDGVEPAALTPGAGNPGNGSDHERDDGRDPDQ